MSEVGLYRKSCNDNKKRIHNHMGKRKSLDLILRIVKPNMSCFHHTCSESGTIVATKNHVKSNDKQPFNAASIQNQEDKSIRLLLIKTLLIHENFLTSESSSFRVRTKTIS